MKTIALTCSPALILSGPDCPVARRTGPRTRAPEIVDKRPGDQGAGRQAQGSHIKKRGDEDPQAIEVIDQLYQEFPSCGKKDRKRGSSTPSTTAVKVKRGESDEGVRDNGLYLAVAVALRDMAPESPRVLMKWIGHKTHRKDIPLQQKLILSLGKTLDEKGRKLLIKTLDDKTPAIQASTAEALGEYENEDQKVRKENFIEMLKILMALKGAVDSDPNDTISRERYDAISAPIITSLQRLSRQKIHDPNEWQRWWNKNKKATGTKNG